MPNRPKTLSTNGFLLAGCLAIAGTGLQTASGEPGDGPAVERAGSIGPKYVERHIIREVLELAETRRIDIVGLGDSNQLFYNFGWQDGWSSSLGTRYEMYASSLLGAGRNSGIGLALGIVENILMLPQGAPPEWAIYNNPLSGVDETPYGYLTPVIQTRPGVRSGMRLRLNHPKWLETNFNEHAALRGHFTYGVGPLDGGMIFQPGIKQTLGPTVIHTPISTMDEQYGVRSGWLDYPAGERNLNDLEFFWFVGGQQIIEGPFFGMYLRMENTEIDHGFSNHTLYWSGGASARLCAVNLQDASDEHLIGYFDKIRELQPAEKKVLIRIAFGGNDRTDSAASVGPNAGEPSNTSKGVADNLFAIINRIKEIWQVAGWDQEELTFLLVGNHHKPTEPPGFGFRDTIANVAKQLDGVAFVNLSELASPLELSTNEWYFEGGSHLTQDGYRALTTREISALIDLPEDLNGDCVVDTADLGVLLSVFGNTMLNEKSLGPDLNFDGIVDTADLGRLIAAFDGVCPE